jgi:hypothetical protein
MNNGRARKGKGAIALFLVPSIILRTREFYTRRGSPSIGSAKVNFGDDSVSFSNRECATNAVWLKRAGRH